MSIIIIIIIIIVACTFSLLGLSCGHTGPSGHYSVQVGCFNRLDLRQHIGSVDDRSWPVRCSSSSWLVIFQTSWMGQTFYCCWSSQFEYQSTWKTSPDSSSCSVCSTSRRLASRTVVHVGSTRRSELQLDYVLEQALWASSVPMRHQGRSRRHSRPCLLADAVQAERLVTTRHTLNDLVWWAQAAPMCMQSRNRLVVCVQTVNVQSDANPMAGWKMYDLGRHCHRHLGWVVYSGKGEGKSEHF